MIEIYFFGIIVGMMMPDWVNRVQFLGDPNDYVWNFFKRSDKINLPSPNLATYQQGRGTQAVMSKPAFSSGKHLFEFVWPVANRGSFACIGESLSH